MIGKVNGTQRKVQLTHMPKTWAKSAHCCTIAISMWRADWYSIPFLRGNLSTRIDVRPNLGKPEAFILDLSHIYPLHTPWSSHTYPVYIPDVSPDMSISPTMTGRSEKRNGGCQPGFRADEAVENCIGSIRQDQTLRSAGHCVARVGTSQAPPGAPVSATKARLVD